MLGEYFYDSIVKIDINTEVSSYEPCIISLDLEINKASDENTIIELIRCIERKYLEFKDLYSHLARYYSELNKENADIGLPQSHIIAA